jgi:Tfp pilus assembly protein PilO
MVEKAIGDFSRLPKRSLIYILVCVGGILCFLGVGILPNQRVISKLDNETSGIKLQLQKQKVLFPVFKKAMQTLHEEKISDMAVLERSGIDRKDINSISSNFRKLASECSLHFKSGIPDVGKINKTSDAIPFILELAGGYFDFRLFLSKIVSLPFLGHIDTIEINAGSSMIEYRLRINLLAGNGVVKK